MRIKVYAPSEADDRLIDDRHFMTLEEGATVSEVLRLLKLNVLMRTLLPIAVNHKSAKRSQKLKDGDVVSIYQVRTGG